MKERRSDLRTQKTYDALIHAFEKLLQEKPFEQITVRELCECARTRTATFYNHFSDKYDFFAFMIREMRRDFASLIDVKSSTETPEDYYVDYLKVGIQFIENHTEMVSAFESDNLLTTILNTASDEMIERLRTHIEIDRQKGRLFPADDNIMVQLLIGTMNQCATYWFNNRNTVKKEYVFEQMTHIIHTLYIAKH